MHGTTSSLGNAPDARAFAARLRLLEMKEFDPFSSVSGPLPGPHASVGGGSSCGGGGGGGSCGGCRFSDGTGESDGA